MFSPPPCTVALAQNLRAVPPFWGHLAMFADLQVALATLPPPFEPQSLETKTPIPSINVFRRPRTEASHCRSGRARHRSAGPAWDCNSLQCMAFTICWLSAIIIRTWIANSKYSDVPDLADQRSHRVGTLADQRSHRLARCPRWRLRRTVHRPVDRRVGSRGGASRR